MIQNDETSSQFSIIFEMSRLVAELHPEVRGMCLGGRFGVSRAVSSYAVATRGLLRDFMVAKCGLGGVGSSVPTKKNKKRSWSLVVVAVKRDGCNRGAMVSMGGGPVGVQCVRWGDPHSGARSAAPRAFRRRCHDLFPRGGIA